ncbi:MAG: hypothetical protein ACRER5_07095, partial [Pseudomonas sp.]
MNGKKHLALLGLAISLSSCAALRPDDTSQSGSSTPPVRPSAQTMAAEGMAQNDVSSNGQAEQQRLLDEINRNGSALDSTGFRDTAPTPVTAPTDD